MDTIPPEIVAMILEYVLVPPKIANAGRQFGLVCRVWYDLITSRNKSRQKMRRLRDLFPNPDEISPTLEDVAILAAAEEYLKFQREQLLRRMVWKADRTFGDSCVTIDNKGSSIDIRNLHYDFQIIRNEMGEYWITHQIRNRLEFRLHIDQFTPPEKIRDCISCYEMDPSCTMNQAFLHAQKLLPG